jgi:thioester reductase-like protein
MTGYTGFVGVNFLARLPRPPHVKEVVCLVREKNKPAPRARVEQVKRKYNLWEATASNFSKLATLDGDIIKVRLDVSTRKFPVVDQVRKSTFASHESHFEANVLDTRNAFHLATSGRRKSFQFTSGIDACDHNGLILGTREFLEDEMLEPNLKGFPYDIGYAASTWASEQIVRHARDRFQQQFIGGSVTGDSTKGAGNPYDSFALAAPDPANSVNLEKTVNVVNDAGYSVERIPYWDYVKRLHNPKNSENPLMPLVPLLQERTWGYLMRSQTSQDTSL